jgi:hypothetical protein
MAGAFGEKAMGSTNQPLLLFLSSSTMRTAKPQITNICMPTVSIRLSQSNVIKGYGCCAASPSARY